MFGERSTLLERVEETSREKTKLLRMLNVVAGLFIIQTNEIV